jgi:hypothetical protein
MSKEASTVELDFSSAEKSFEQLSIEQQQQLAAEEEEPRVTLKTWVVVSVSQSQYQVLEAQLKLFRSYLLDMVSLLSRFQPWQLWAL